MVGFTYIYWLLDLTLSFNDLTFFPFDLSSLLLIQETSEISRVYIDSVVALAKFNVQFQS
jgi:hypothetical protein